VGVYLFGSVVRGDDTLDSDLDVLLIAKDDAHRNALLEQLLTDAVAIRARFGLSVSPIGYTLREARRASRARAAPWPELQRDVVALDGPSLLDALR
jgi:hypothetical protein